VADYRKLRPDIKLSIKKSDLDALNGTGLFTQCAAGGAGNPDIAAVEISYSGFWRSYPQCFVDLRTLNNKDGKDANDIKKDYLPWRWEHGVGYNDSVIGIPTDVGGLEVAYRWDLFKKAGLPYKRDEVSKAWNTWPKFIEFGKKYVAKLTAAQKKANVGFIDNVGTIYPAVMNQGTEKYYRNNGTDQGQLIFKTNKQVKLAFDTTVAASNAKITAAKRGAARHEAAQRTATQRGEAQHSTGGTSTGRAAAVGTAERPASPRRNSLERGCPVTPGRDGWPTRPQTRTGGRPARCCRP
jgi:cellobiose transport system substrate-binding protein